MSSNKPKKETEKKPDDIGQLYQMLASAIAKSAQEQTVKLTDAIAESAAELKMDIKEKEKAQKISAAKLEEKLANLVRSNETRMKKDIDEKLQQQTRAIDELKNMIAIQAIPQVIRSGDKKAIEAKFRTDKSIPYPIPYKGKLSSKVASIGVPVVRRSDTQLIVVPERKHITPGRLIRLQETKRLEVGPGSEAAKDAYRQLLHASPSGIVALGYDGKRASFDSLPTGLFTQSPEGPVYVENWTRSNFKKSGALMTFYIWKQMNMKDIRLLLKKQPTRFYWLLGYEKAIPPGYKPQIEKIRTIYRAAEGLKRGTPEEKVMTAFQISQAVQILGEEEVRAISGIRLSADATRLITSMVDIGHGRRVAITKMFDGTMYSIPFTVEWANSDELFFDMLKFGLQDAAVFGKASYAHSHIIMQLTIFFKTIEIPQETIKDVIFTGKTPAQFDDEKYRHDFYTTLRLARERKDSNPIGYHYQQYVRDADATYLDRSTFLIEIFDVSQSAGAPRDDNHNKTFTRTLSWCKYKNYVSKNHGCFFAILRKFLKDHSRTKARNYIALWELLDIKLAGAPYNQPKTRERALKAKKAPPQPYIIAAAKYFKIDLTIYAMNKKILYESKDCRDLRLKIINYDSHYYHVIKMGTFESDAERKERAVSLPLDSIKVYYDYETVAIAGCNNIRPYSLSFAIEDGEIETSMNAALSIHYDALTATMLQRLKYWAFKQPGNKRYNFKMIAYNGSGFDHHILFKHCSGAGMKILAAPGKSKITTMTVSIGEGHVITVWDPYLFLKTSLSNAAKSFNLPYQKGHFDHREMQSKYNEIFGPKIEEEKKSNPRSRKEAAKEILKPYLDAQEKEKATRKEIKESTATFRTYLETKHIEIKKYNEQDIEVLRFLTKELDKLNLDILRKPTIGRLAWDKFREITARTLRGKAPLVFKAQDLQEHQEEIRGSIIGGRTQPNIDAKTGKTIPHHIFSTPGVLLDVVSLYPHVMENNNFPYGSSERFETYGEAIAHWESGKLCLWECEVDSSSLKTHSILPKYDPPKCKGDKWTKSSPLKWDTFGVAVTLLPRVTIEDFLDAGIEVNFTGVGYVWSEQGPVFKAYVAKYEKLKEEQDEYKENEDKRYNPVLREMYKLILNSLSGKVGQKEYYSKLVYYDMRDSKDRQDFITAVASGSETDTVSHNGSYARIPKVYTSSRAYPVQLAVYIYAYARSYMWRNIFSKMKVYYSDTDSALVDWTDFSGINNVYRPKRFHGVIDGEFKKKKEFGDFEIEELADEVYAPAPKAYALVYNGKDVRSRLRGIRAQDTLTIDGVAIGSITQKIWYIGDQKGIIDYGEIYDADKNKIGVVDNDTITYNDGTIATIQEPKTYGERFKIIREGKEIGNISIGNNAIEMFRAWNENREIKALTYHILKNVTRGELLSIVREKIIHKPKIR